MRISELAEQSGVSVATIKYYLREGLLPAGRKVTTRLAEYDDRHLRRLRLLRVLRDVGGIPVEGLKGLVAAVDDPTASVHEMFGAACDALTPGRGGAAAGEETHALAERVSTLAGWDRVRPDAPGWTRLAEVLEVVGDYGRGVSTERVAAYLRLVDAIAAFELAQVDAAQDRDAMLEQMVIGQVVYGELLLSLRRLAHEHHSALRFGDTAQA